MQQLAYFDRTGAEIDHEEWACRFATPGYDIVLVSERDGLKVSTIWVGVNSINDEVERPSIFETAVSRDGDMRFVRAYSTEDEAYAGHRELAEEVFDGDVPADPVNDMLDQALAEHDDAVRIDAEVLDVEQVADLVG